MPGKRYTLVLNFGYAESQRLGFMPWSCDQTFKNAKAAVVDLATYLRDQFLKDQDSESKVKKCCLATKAKDDAAIYCSKCGIGLTERQFDGENFAGWLVQLDSDNDTFNQYIDWDLDNLWQAGQLENQPNLRFIYNAEWVLAAAVGYNKHKDRTFDDICKARTKSKNESFNYY